MNKQQEQFIESYVKHSNATQAAIEAGYSEKTARVQGSQLVKRYQNEIDQKVKEELNALQGLAVNHLRKLLEAESEAVQMAATKDILDRTGHKPTEKQEIIHDAKPSPQEVQEQIMAYIQRNGIQH